ncbi:hypothetical protein OHA70_39375 [Kribbella sp. NBC_00382]|uniref:hypothetical protein n=1 Tax=Kribbella sp. NBC_00382 TaxID=2975967 RepID=UPI002E1CA257
MQLRHSFLAIVLAALAFTASACAADEAPDPAPNLLGEYLKSTSVRNDRFPNTGGSSEDRLANLAAHYSAEQLQSRLLLAFPCSTSEGQDEFFDTSCSPSTAAAKTAERLGGKLNARVLVVKHKDNSLELLTLYLAGNQAIDETGKTYTDLKEFRSTNELLTSSDLILTPAELTAVPGKGGVVTVYAHTKPTWPRYLLGSLVVLLVLVLAAVLLRRRSRGRSAPA